MKRRRPLEQRRMVQLELPGFSGEADKLRHDLWASVDSLNDRTTLAHRVRKKLVKPKLKQRNLLSQEPLPPPEDD